MSHSKSSIFQLGKDTTKYRLLTREHVKQEIWRGKEMLVVEPQALTVLAKEAFKDVSHLLRPTSCERWRIRVTG
ncbi:MAG TPA: hypothetical protein PKH78_12235, partial [Candidatus Obscuribacter sp.]|nr:hypothetical protein [Candidatus Obscuribacter sp.]